VKEGLMQETEEFIEGWEELMERLKEVESDIPISEFLTKSFPGEKYNDLREAVSSFVEGYDAADVNRASTVALREEWENEDEDQERIPVGYNGLLAFLLEECKMLGCELLLSKEVLHVNWSTDHVEVKTATESFHSHKVLVTIPLSLWQAKEGTKGYISYMPALPLKEEAAREMGYGSVIKILFLFDNRFWEEAIPNKMNNAGFIFSDAEIPTWWTQHPRTSPLLTGWLGGPKSINSELQNHSIVIEKGIQSLAYIFGVSTAFVSERLKAHKVFNWSQEPYSLGAYSYATIASKNAKKIVGEPVDNTLFFAGEALYEGKEIGTVEAALASGLQVAKQILRSSST
jgi:monoamine oxidase